MKSLFAAAAAWLAISMVCAGPSPGVERTAGRKGAAPTPLTPGDAARWQRLRDQGPEGLRVLLAERDQFPPGDARRRQWDEAIDYVAQQRHAWASGLYWHTDFSAAAAAAEASQKPILSLRLLGLLTDEYSCANSRFFRTALYANSEISQLLRERFVLHWSSERPAPRLTIDFGDGRVLTRTVTGNSIHYLLSPGGQPLDALPGLNGPGAFLQWLRESLGLWESSLGRGADPLPTFVAAHHARQLTILRQQWERAQARAGLQDPAAGKPFQAEGPPADARAALARPTPPAIPTAIQAPPTAERALPIGVPKGVTEGRFLPALTMRGASPEEVTDPQWARLAESQLPLCQLDQASRELIDWQNPLPQIVEGREAAIQAMLDQFTRNMAIETVRNRFLARRKIHEWLAQQPLDLDRLNARVYSELFLTPRSDPWVGLVAPDAYTGLSNDGLAERRQPRERRAP